MRILAGIVLGLWLLTGLGACGGTSMADQVRARAAFDFECEKSHIRVTWIDENTAGATGCGQRAAYVQVCGDSAFEDCKWVLNSHRTRRDDD